MHWKVKSPRDWRFIRAPKTSPLYFNKKIFNIFLIEVYYVSLHNICVNIVLVSDAQQSDSVIYITFSDFFFPIQVNH